MILSARSQQANVWIFGDSATMDFNFDPPVEFEANSMKTAEGPSSICDANGNLVLYTDGSKVYNSKHQLIAEGLAGDITSSQTSLIIPHPAQKDIYYIFTVTPSAPLYDHPGYYYSVADMTLNEGTGGLLKKNVLLHHNGSEKLTAIESVDCKFTWILTQEVRKNVFYAYKLDEHGLNEEPVVSPGGKEFYNYSNHSMGSLKISPDGTKVAHAVYGGQYDELGWLEIFDFDIGSGKVSNTKMIYDANENNKLYVGFYSVVFSPNSKIIYTCYDGYRPAQIDLTKENLELTFFTDYPIRSMELGPNNKIYAIFGIPSFREGKGHENLNGYGTVISAIHNPNEMGGACQFEPNYYKLQKGHTQWSLPNFPQSFFYEDSLVIDYSYSSNCLGEETQFNIDLNYPVNDYWWDFGDPSSGNLNVSYDSDPLHRFQLPGKYEVNLYSIDICKRRDVVSKDVILYPDPTFDIPFDTLQRCYFEDPFIADLPKYEFTDYYVNHKLAGDNIQFDQRGDYLVTLSNECFTQEDQFFYDLVPELIPPLAADTFFCAGEIGVLSARNDLAFYDWNTGDTTKEIEVYDDGEYEVTLNSTCQTISDKTSVKFIDKDIKKNAINVFTPNGDGFNEVFENYAVHSPNYRTQIFNRYGTLLFETKNPEIFWDGFVNGKPAVSGVYYYYTETMNCQAEPITIKGAFSLLK